MDLYEIKRHYDKTLMASKIRHSTPASVKPPERRAVPLKPTSWLPAIQFLFCVAILGAALYRAIALRWISDDAFITLRYVQNFVEGHGLVYNVGERVEGYTHFLWLLLLATARSLGFDPVDASVWLGIAAYGAIIVIFLSISRKESARKSHQIAFPIAATLIALNHDVNVWASGGLETSLYALLISLAFYIWFYTSLPEGRRSLAVGAALLFATLTRPDGALFTIMAVLLLFAFRLWQKQTMGKALKQCALLVAPSLIVGIPYLIWKYNYYGDIFPTPYYAKSADSNYFPQGLFYIWLFFKVYISAGLGLLLAIGLAIFAKRLLRTDAQRASPGAFGSAGSPLLTALIMVMGYLLLFVARVGGDFMFARFIVPVLPLIYFTLERIIDYLPSTRYRWSLTLLFVASVLVENNWRDRVLFHRDATTGELEGNWDNVNGGETHGIADERWVYYRKRFLLSGVGYGSLEVYSEIGKYYESLFAGLPVIVAIPGAQNMIAYYANFQTCINEYGLTDSYIAHLPITSRGRIGHEKKAPDEYLKRRGVQFELSAVVGSLPETPSYVLAAFAIPQLDVWQVMRVVNYDKPVIDELYRRVREAENRCLLPKYEILMPSYINNVMQTLPLKQVEEDYKGFQEYYFEKYPDSQAQGIIERYIALKRDSAKQAR
jgi:hypothetical protein